VKDENTVIAHLRYLCSNEPLRTPPNWPPDLFALVGSLLLNSGAYRHAMSAWPPVAAWESKTQKIATAWRRRWNARKAPPPEVRSIWRRVLKFSNVALDEIISHRELCVTLLKLCAIADETSFSLGIPPSSSIEFDRFYIHAAILLANESGATLCEKIHESKI